MAMQSGIALYKIVLMVGAGYTGTMVMKNSKLSNALGELRNLVKRIEGECDGDSDHSDAIASQVRRLAMEVRQLASSRQISVLNGNPEQSNLTSLVMPTAALGALGYGYMWWKGISFSDLMFVTKSSMANAVANLTKHLDHVSEALAATKRHLTQRIQNLDGKLDEQVEISKLLRNEVNDVCGDISRIGFDLDELQRTLSGLDGKLLSIEENQELTNAGVMYLCSAANGINVKTPKTFQDQLKLAGNSPSMGLKAIANSVSSGNKLFTKGNAKDDSTHKLNIALMRNLSAKCWLQSFNVSSLC